MGAQPGSGTRTDVSSHETPETRWKPLFFVGVLILAASGVVMIYMLAAADDASTTEIIWGRRIFIYAAAEAIAFTVVGWLFGREVHRSAVESADRQAAVANANAAATERMLQAKTEEAADAKAKAASLAHAVITSAQHAGPAPEFAAPGSVSHSQLAFLRELAERLFPETANATEGRAR